MPRALTGITAQLGCVRSADLAGYARAYRKANLEKSREYARSYHQRRKSDTNYLEAKNRSAAFTRRKRKYGINREEYARRLTEQGYVCKICNMQEIAMGGLRVDHCHKTGHIRGLLCNSCNNGLGRFKDNPELLIRAAQYIKENDLVLDVRLRSVELKGGENGGTLIEAIPCQAPRGEGVETIPKGSTAKRPEAPPTER